jgi:hypothetical protein
MVRLLVYLPPTGEPRETENPPEEDSEFGLRLEQAKRHLESYSSLNRERFEYFTQRKLMREDE